MTSLEARSRKKSEKLLSERKMINVIWEKIKNNGSFKKINEVMILAAITTSCFKMLNNSVTFSEEKYKTDFREELK